MWQGSAGRYREAEAGDQFGVGPRDRHSFQRNVTRHVTPSQQSFASPFYLVLTFQAARILELARPGSPIAKAPGGLRGLTGVKRSVRHRNITGEVVLGHICKFAQAIPSSHESSFGSVG